MPDQIEGKAAEGIAAPVPPAAAPPKPTAAKPKKAEANPTKDVDKQRRRMIWACVWGYLGINFLMFLRFFFPRALYEPNPIFSIGYPADFALGIDQRFLMTGRVWVIREPGRIFVILCALHAFGLHTRVEVGGKQIQVSLSRQRL